jgi:hypothetical protein
MCRSVARHHGGWVRSISRPGKLIARLIASATAAIILPASCTGMRKLAVHRSSYQMLSTIMRSAPCQETWSRRDGERSSLNQASETRGLGREMAMTSSVLGEETAVQQTPVRSSTSVTSGAEAVAARGDMAGAGIAVPVIKVLEETRSSADRHILCILQVTAYQRRGAAAPHANLLLNVCSDPTLRSNRDKPMDLTRRVCRIM